MSGRKYFYTAIVVSLLPFVWLLWQWEVLGGYLPTLANVFGLMGATVLLWQFLLGNRFVSIKLRENFVDTTKLHILLGSYGTVFVFLHPFLQMVAYDETLSFVFFRPPVDTFSFYVGLGRTAFWLFLIIWVTSALLRKRMAYRPWLYIHYLTYPLLIFVFLHASKIGTFINSQPLVGLYWNLLTALFVFGVFWRIANYLNFGKARYRLISKKKVGSGIYEFVFGSIGKRIRPKPGQFSFLRLGFFGEAHPYTVMGFDSEGGTLKYGVKVVGPHSKKMSKLKRGDVVWVDGPYGTFTRKGQNEEPKVIFAGGIGVTPFVEFVLRHANEETYMFYANKRLEDAVERRSLKDVLGERYVDVVSREKRRGRNVETGRINEEIIEKYLDKKFLKNCRVFLCGSQSFMESVEDLLVGLGVGKEQIFKEEFSL